jgi:hypothetical protein
MIMSRRWNANNGAWESYTPAKRQYPSLSPDLERQLSQIEPSRDGSIQYFPCAVTLSSGETIDCVYLAGADSYIRTWGVWPDEDSGKRAIQIEDARAIHPSGKRLPYRFAQQMYAAGESGMGYCAFTLRFSDGLQQAYCTGNLVDFVPLPTGKSTSDIAELHPHQGRGEHALKGFDYFWCLFGRPQKQTLMQRLGSIVRFS